MRSITKDDKDPVDKVALVTSLVGMLAHVGMLGLDALLLRTSVQLVTSTDSQDAVVLATALTGAVMLHLLVVAWVGRHVVDWLEVSRDHRLPSFARRTRARAAARRAGAALLFSGALAPAAALLLMLVPLLAPQSMPMAAL